MVPPLAYLDVRDWKTMALGEMFTDSDVRNGNKVCVVGNTIKQTLFPKTSPVGRKSASTTSPSAS